MDISQLARDPISYHLLFAAGLGLVIGLERELSGKDPGLRTFALICMGSCCFTLLSISSVKGIQGADPSRIAAQIVSGIGFLGVGTIFRSKRGVSGLTTAALMWMTASIGMAVGFDRYDLAVTGTLIAVCITFIIGLGHRVARITRGAAEPDEGSEDEF
jgi:putative Mg2+ transporter-C (MgtC) family protein